MHIDSHTPAKPSEHMHLVGVTINGSHTKIAAGEYSGSSLKAAFDVPLNHELEQVTGHQFHPVANGDQVTIKGGEKFVSHCGQGQSA